ncbi:YopT-type cysteine protease domain-containing protein [Bradyrhizobium sp. Pa8]|uniref:YopT-type cysteine protease domain-containing protein n=1 Tax=Bradyrhizobium sp. Pa8 TaxID=3386552 RepID=UPI00403FC1C8
MDSDEFLQVLGGMSSGWVPRPDAGLSPAPSRPCSVLSQPQMLELEKPSLAGTKQNLPLRRKLPPGELPPKLGCCASTPHAFDPNDPSTSSPARPSTSLFQYRTAELRDANVNGICVGLVAEWLANLNRSPSSRMNALTPGSQMHHSAAARQQQYQNRKDQLRSEGAGASEADLDAQNTILREAGLAPSGREKVYRFGEPSSVSRMLGKISEDGSTYLLSLYFVEGGAHTVATSTSDGRITLFDPNFGEFTVQSSQGDELFQSLSNRYRNPNGQHLSTVTTQKMY